MTLPVAFGGYGEHMKKLSAALLGGILAITVVAAPANAHGRHIVNGKGKIKGQVVLKVAGNFVDGSNVPNLCASIDLSAVSVAGPSGTVAASIKSAKSSVNDSHTTSYCTVSYEAKRLLKGNYSVSYTLRCDGAAAPVAAASCTAAQWQTKKAVAAHTHHHVAVPASPALFLSTDPAYVASAPSVDSGATPNPVATLGFTRVAPVKAKKAGATVVRTVMLTLVPAA